MHLTAQSEDFRKWIMSSKHQEVFARAWLDGYEVQKEKRYTVKIKGMDEGYNFFNFSKRIELWILSDSEGNNEYHTHHTHKELEDAGFGWVFDCDGVEVEEVE